MPAVRLIVIGGSGHWSELNHYPAILKARREGLQVQVVAICDPQNPYTIDESHFSNGRRRLQEVLASDKPQWINPEDYDSDEMLLKSLDSVVAEHDVQAVIVACNPTVHYLYAHWAVNHQLHVLCDKPFVVTSDASWQVQQAQQIEHQFVALAKKVRDIQVRDPGYLFCTPLRRRVLTPFMTVADSIRKVHSETGQGLTHLNLLSNGGIHRYPREFLKGGAHGYVDGVGSLSHSSYHYLDLMAWYLQLARGATSSISMRLVQVTRVKDYLESEGYRNLMLLNGEKPDTVADGVSLTPSILNAELDFTLLFTLLDAQGKKQGTMSFSQNHTTFTPRTTRYEPAMLDHANHAEGGRMSQVFMDLHQGPLQNWHLVKNDVVFQENALQLTHRQHPLLGEPFADLIFKNVYDEQTITPIHLLEQFLHHIAGTPKSGTHFAGYATIHKQTLSERIFSAAYELLADEYENPDANKAITISL